MKTLILAPWAVVEDGVIVEAAAVWVEGDKIGGWARADGVDRKDYDQVVELDHCVLSPGWLNAHTHWDYGFLRGNWPRGGSFIEWLQQMVEVKRRADRAAVSEAMVNSAEESLRSGCTTVLTICSFPEWIPDAFQAAPRTIWAIEWIDFLQPIAADFLEERMSEYMRRVVNFHHSIAISPHAPYTASPDLYRMALDWASRYNVICTTHLAESEAEWKMWTEGDGEMSEWLSGRFWWQWTVGQTPVSSLVQSGGMTGGMLIAHGNYLCCEDYAWLKRYDATVVHCPRCHGFFGHQDFDWESYRRSEINVCVATDSLASTSSLDLRGELFYLKQQNPEWSERELWRSVTLYPARGLRLADCCGRISAGLNADLVAFPLRKELEPWSFIYEENETVSWVMMGGKISVI
ncbi:MAG: amidohydrolase family protein [Methylacidiphilales bacterium]|nr:amidohydrolase family protein [Candidatus Methylacidiphilales bacterium]